MTCAYDAWRTTAPESPWFHGELRHPLLIEAGDVSIDAIGVYDGNGDLLSVEINKRHVAPCVLRQALALLGCDYPGWDGPLDRLILDDLIRDAIEGGI